MSHVGSFLRADNFILSGHAGGPGTPQSHKRRSSTRHTPKLPPNISTNSITGLIFQVSHSFGCLCVRQMNNSSDSRMIIRLYRAELVTASSKCGIFDVTTAIYGKNRNRNTAYHIREHLHRKAIRIC